MREKAEPDQVCHECKDGQIAHGPTLCSYCPVGRAGVGGACAPCGAGTQANLAHTACS